tara:strand:- start:8 stop:361 length:354 start_codon:yes stop_codon:yes gene_type:complete
MSTKEELITVIKTWVKTDNEIKQLQDAIKNKKNEKKLITEQLLEIMKTNEIDCFDINNGKIMYTKTKSKQAVSKKLLLSTLSDYFKDDCDTAIQVANHILDSRGEKITESIRRKDIK